MEKEPFDFKPINTKLIDELMGQLQTIEQAMLTVDEKLKEIVPDSFSLINTKQALLSTLICLNTVKRDLKLFRRGEAILPPEQERQKQAMKFHSFLNNLEKGNPPPENYGV